MEETSLDEFRSSGDSAPSDGNDGSISDDTRLEPSRNDELAATTTRWTPDGAVCEACRSEVFRLWQEDGRPICQSCKDW